MSGQQLDETVRNSFRRSVTIGDVNLEVEMTVYLMRTAEVCQHVKVYYLIEYCFGQLTAVDGNLRMKRL